LTDDLSQIERCVSPLPEQVRADHIKNRPVIMDIRCRQIDSGREVEFFENGQGYLVKIIIAIVESQGHTILGQIVRI
jgi:hypothetical protein